MNKQLKAVPLPLAEWDSSLSSIAADMNQQPLNVHKLMANHPGLLRAWWNFRNYSVSGGALGRRKGELVILRVAVHMKAWYEWASHVERSLACGLSLDEIESIRKTQLDANWKTDEGLLLEAVDELIATRGLSSQSLIKLNEFYDATQLMDIMAIHGMYIILACMINTWGLELDSQVKEKLPPSLSREQFEVGFS